MLAHYVYRAIINFKFSQVLIDKEVISDTNFMDVFGTRASDFFVFKESLPMKLEEFKEGRAFILTNLKGLLYIQNQLRKFIKDHKKLVLVVIDDTIADSRGLLKFLGIPIIEPSYVKEVYRAIALATCISDELGIPVAVRIPSFFLNRLEECDESEMICLEKMKQEIFCETVKGKYTNILEVFEKNRAGFSKFDIVYPKMIKLEKIPSVVIAVGACYDFVIKTMMTEESIENVYVLRPLITYPLVSEKIHELLKKAIRIIVFELGTAIVGTQVIHILNKMFKSGEISEMPYIEIHELPVSKEEKNQLRIKEIIENFFGIKSTKMNSLQSFDALTSFCPGCPVIPFYLMAKNKKMRLIVNIDCEAIQRLIRNEFISNEYDREIYIIDKKDLFIGAAKDKKYHVIAYIPKLEIEETTPNNYEILAKELPELEAVNPYDLESLAEYLEKGGIFYVLSTCPTRRAGDSVAKILPNCDFCLECAILSKCPAIMLKNNHLTIDEGLCWGCGLCEKLCKKKAITLVLR